jgi:hypothetical protein
LFYLYIFKGSAEVGFEAVEFATLEWVDWFNRRRLLEPIGNIPPAEPERRYFAMLEQSKVAAQFNPSASGKPGVPWPIIASA